MSNLSRRDESLRALERELKNRERSEKSKPLSVVILSLVVILVICSGIWYLASRDSGDNEATTQASGTSDENKASEKSSTTESETPDAEKDNKDKSKDQDSPFPLLSTTRKTPLADTVACEYTKRELPEGAKPLEGDRTPALPSDNEAVSTKGTVNLTLTTNNGPVTIALDRAAAPCTVHSFESLVAQKYYDNTKCHRETSGGLNVLQCGDPTGTGMGGPHYAFKDEYPVDELGGRGATPVTYPAGSVAMANSGPNTNGSQFFLNYDKSTLPPNYTYIGTVDAQGMETLKAIAAKGIAGGGNDGAPKEDVIIETATIDAQ